MPAADSSWRLLRVAELMRAIEQRQDHVLRILDGVQPAIAPSFARTIRRAQVQHVREAVAQMRELLEQIDPLVEPLAGEAVRVTYDDLRSSAEHVLREGGTLDESAVLLAARLLDRQHGLSALAEGLRSGGVYASWDRTTVGGLLTAFRGVTPQRARRIATAAGVAPGAEIAGCRRDEIARLADQLDHHAEG